jgi:glycosyltransferase involved in cell wall biosynthesis
MAAMPYEGFSMALVEAFAARCLVLGTDVPSVRELFAMGGDGIDFLSGDAEHLAKNMRFLQRNRTRRENQAFVERVRVKLDAEQMARAYYEAGVT